MRTILKFLIRGLLVILIWNGLACFCKSRTDGFSVARLQSEIPYDQKWQLPPPSPQQQQEIESILSQPFFYLGRGGQCFVFVSQDQHYVIKFFKNRLYKPYEWLRKIPLCCGLDHLRDKKIQKILAKIDRDCTSYKIAYEEIPEETGLIYLQLRPMEGWNPSLLITDKIGISHRISLNSTAFLIQKRAEPIASYLKTVSGHPDEARRALRALLFTISHCAQKGIFDDDPGLHRNFGFLEGTPLFIDVGRFKKEKDRASAQLSQQELAKITSRFRRFLFCRYPDLVTLLDEELHAIQTPPPL